MLVASHFVLNSPKGFAKAPSLLWAAHFLTCLRCQALLVRGLQNTRFVNRAGQQHVFKVFVQDVRVLCWAFSQQLLQVPRHSGVAEARRAASPRSVKPNPFQVMTCHMQFLLNFYQIPSCANYAQSCSSEFKTPMAPTGFWSSLISGLSSNEYSSCLVVL